VLISQLGTVVGICYIGVESFIVELPMVARIVTLLLAVLIISGCNSAYRGTTSGAIANQTGGDGLNHQQSCVQSCDSAHARCLDGGGPRRETDSSLGSVFGSRQECAAELRKCLPQCQGR
jgi:hypothetical protein